MCREINVVREAVHGQKVFELPCHQVLIHVSHHNEMFAGMLEQKGVEICVEEVDGVAPLPLWPVAYTEQDGVALSCPQPEECHFEVAFHVDIEGLHSKTVTEADCDSPEGTVGSVSSVPSRVPLNMPKVGGNGGIEKGLHCDYDVWGVRDNIRVFRSTMLVWRPLMLVDMIVSFSWKVGSAGIIPRCVGVLRGMRCLALRRLVTGERRVCEVLV